MEGFLTIKEVADKWGLSTRRVQKMCSDGLVPGASKFGRDWAIPADATRPVDGRITTGDYIAWRNKTEKEEE